MDQRSSTRGNHFNIGGKSPWNDYLQSDRIVRPLALSNLVLRKPIHLITVFSIKGAFVERKGLSVRFLFRLVRVDYQSSCEKEKKDLRGRLGIWHVVF